MVGSVLPRERHRYSGRVRVGRFVPMVLLTLLIAVTGGWLLHQAFAVGWYIHILAPLVVMFPLLICVSFAVTVGECRSRVMAAGLGALAGVVLYGSFFYFGMLALMGPQQALRFDQLPRYVMYRMRTDVSHQPGRQPNAFSTRGTDPVDNWIHFAVELGMLVAMLTSLAYRRANRAYCETCGQWMTASALRFAPGRGQTIAEWMDTGELDQLALLPPATASNRAASTKVTVEFCPVRKQIKPCPTFISVKEFRPAKAEHQLGSGSMRVPRSQLRNHEVDALRTMFNLPGSTDVAAVESAGDGALVEVEPLPAAQARRVLGPIGIWIGTVLTLCPLILVWAVIPACYYLFSWSQLSEVLEHRAVDRVHLLTGSLGLLACVGLGLFMIFIGLKNPGVIGNRWLRFLARRSFANRTGKLVDVSKPTTLPTFFVQIVPRANWGRHMLENASDTGFMQIDAHKNEVRFEGDVERIRFSGSAITSVKVEHYSTEMGKTSLMYSVAVVRGRTAAGPFEAPFSIRGTDWIVGADHRQANAELLRSWLESIRPAVEVQLAEIDDEPLIAVSPALAYEPAMATGPDKQNFFRRHWLRLSITTLAVLAGVIHGALRGRQQRAMPFNANNFADILLVNARASIGIPLQVSNVHTVTNLPGVPSDAAPPPSWTVFDCSTTDGSAAGFTIALANSKPGLGVQTDVVLPHTQPEGMHLIEAMSSAIGQPTPPGEALQPLKPTKYSGLRLGEKLSAPEAKFKHNGGSWVVDQWDINSDGLNDVLFFSYDLTSGRAMLSHGARGNNVDGLQSLAGALRDGPRPPRSPANDPTFTDSGPTLINVRPVEQSNDCRLEFARGGKVAFLLPSKPDRPLRGIRLEDQSTTETLADNITGRIADVAAIDPDADALLVETTERSSNVAAAGRAAFHLWFIDRAQHHRHEIIGPWGRNGAMAGENSAVSPDGRYVLVRSWTQQILNPDAATELYAYDLKTETSNRINTKLRAPVVAGWTAPTKATLTEADDDETANNTSNTEIDCVTGSEIMSPPTPKSAATRADSPDGLHRFELVPQQSIDIIDTRNGSRQTLHFAPLDRRSAVEGSFKWLDSRYIQFYADKPLFIDIAKMKVGRMPTLGGKTPLPPIFSPDFKWAWTSDIDGVTLAKVQEAP